jgi:predicted transcriptional regulator
MKLKDIGGMYSTDGEMHADARLALIYPRRKNGFDRWFSMGQDAMLALAQDDFGEKARVLFAILSILDYENWIVLNQVELSKKIGMRVGNFNRYLKVLEKKGIIKRGEKNKRNVTFCLNPDFGWKGSASNHKRALKEKMDKLGITVVKD